MIDTLSSAVLAWLLTYLIHSSALLLLAWAITRWRIWSPGATDLFWKVALVGGLVSASVQLGLELRPAGSVSIARATHTVQAPLVTQGENLQAASATVEATELVRAPSTATESTAQSQLAAPSITSGQFITGDH